MRAAQRQAAGQQVVVERDVPVAMRDGIRLATDIYRPGEGERRPALLYRTPYDKSDGWVVGGLVLSPFTAVERGYVVVVQDVRGRCRSEGAWTPFVNEGADGYDTVEWVAEQEWCNADVGVYGSSYMGVTALQAAMASPPRLRAAMTYMTGANYHRGWVYSGGAFELGFNFYWTALLVWDSLKRIPDRAKRRAVAAKAAHALGAPAEVLRTRPLADIEPFRQVAPYWLDWLEHPTYDEYWASIDATRDIERLRVPLLQVGGWYDNFLRGQLDLSEAISGHPDSRVRDSHRLVIGPWAHETYQSLRMSAAGERNFGAAATTGLPFLQPLALRWFDEHMRDGEPATGAMVRYFDMGAGGWNEGQAWPPAHRIEELYLHSGGSANTRFGDGRLEETSPDHQPADEYLHDPDDPVPTAGGRLMSPLVGPGGVVDQRGVEDRRDVLVYTGNELVEPLHITGRVSVVLYAASDAPSADFTAKLVDVEPAGYSAVVADGIRRVAEIGSVAHEVEIDLWDVAHTFQPGHRVLLEVSSSNFPRFDVNRNGVTTGQTTVATQRVLHDGSHRSRLVLPVRQG